MDPGKTTSQHVAEVARLLASGDHAAALTCCERVLQLSPQEPWLLCQQGQLLLLLDRASEAIEPLRTAAGQMPAAADLLAVALAKTARQDEAVAIWNRLEEAGFASAALYRNRGMAYRSMGRPASALADFDRIAGEPDVDLWRSRLSAMGDLGLMERLTTECDRSVRWPMSRSVIDGYRDAAAACEQWSRSDLACDLYRRLLARAPQLQPIHSDLLVSMHYRHGNDAPVMDAEHRRWRGKHAPKRLSTPFVHVVGSQRRLRLGYVSPDLRRCATGRFIAPVLLAHDPRDVEVFCYATRPPPSQDPVWGRLTQKLSAKDLSRLTLQQAVAAIRGDQLDVVVDLAGHMNNPGLSLFVHRMAAVQATYLGYPNRTWLPAMDYRITDAVADPPTLPENAEAERLLRLPVCAWSYEPPEHSPEPSPLPAETNGYITFGCLNRVSKLSPECMAMFGEVLRAVPNSRLMLPNPARASEASPESFLVHLAAHGIPADRVELVPHATSETQYFERYRLIDIALDSSPYNGTTTTCDALWMGVPVITLAGDCHVSRVGVTLLTAMSLPEWTAHSRRSFTSIAGMAVADLPALSKLRKSLREKMRCSPLGDGERLAKAITKLHEASVSGTGD